jgi:uncharacterized protein
VTQHFLEIAGTPSVRAAQSANGSGGHYPQREDLGPADRLTETEAQFIAERDSFYLATVSESGWPYVQHRGGPKGFLRVLDPRRLAFLDFRGNRQYLSLGNANANNRVALLLLDYPRRQRLKLFAHLSVKTLGEDPELEAMLALPGYSAKPERIMLLKLEAYDWNCPRHITRRFSEAELEDALGPIRAHISRLERENADLRAALAAKETPT